MYAHISENGRVFLGFSSFSVSIIWSCSSPWMVRIAFVEVISIIWLKGQFFDIFPMLGVKPYSNILFFKKAKINSDNVPFYVKVVLLLIVSQCFSKAVKHKSKKHCWRYFGVLLAFWTSGFILSDQKVYAPLAPETPSFFIWISEWPDLFDRLVLSQCWFCNIDNLVLPLKS